jgi:hypothetical protein
MYNQMDECQITIDRRDFCSAQDVCLEMNAPFALNADECQQLAGQTGQLLVAIGNLIASQPAISAHVSAHTSENLVSLGRKLISAGQCACNF